VDSPASPSAFESALLDRLDALIRLQAQQCALLQLFVESAAADGGEEDEQPEQDLDGNAGAMPRDRNTPL
jgi:hypothetical protein